MGAAADASAIRVVQGVTCRGGRGRPEEGLSVLLKVLFVGIKHSYGTLSATGTSRERGLHRPSSHGRSFFAQCYGTAVSQGSRCPENGGTCVAVENNRDF